ncbi:MAG: cyclohexanone monooxygenase, partial [Alcaligenaceae bacterium]|nr:cyclohexanone monooxygenase [Alcaligenaceae bacterium]
RTLYAYSKDTWFYGSNAPGKPVVFMPYVGGGGNYYQRILKVAQDGYEGYTLSPATQSSNKVA